jgi:hypothetical protein
VLSHEEAPDELVELHEDEIIPLLLSQGGEWGLQERLIRTMAAEHSSKLPSFPSNGIIDWKMFPELGRRFLDILLVLGTSMEAVCWLRFRSVTSASRAKSKSCSWRRADFRDSSKRTSSNFFVRSNGISLALCGKILMRTSSICGR